MSVTVMTKHNRAMVHERGYTFTVDDGILTVVNNQNQRLACYNKDEWATATDNDVAADPTMKEKTS